MNYQQQSFAMEIDFLLAVAGLDLALGVATWIFKYSITNDNNQLLNCRYPKFNFC